MLIRAVAAADFDDWLVLWRLYQEFYRVDIPRGTTQTVWARLLDPAEPMDGAVAVHDGRCTGLVHYVRHRSCWSIGDSCYLNDLFVETGSRGRGLGRQLIDHVYAAAAQSGCSRVYWLTHETNAGAMALYDQVAERSGFVEYQKSLA
jgi:GNAT superfamily N-acetyltransferase